MPSTFSVIIVATNQCNAGCEYCFQHRSGEALHLDHLAVLASFAAMAIDHARSHNRAKQMAITDALTGLYNNRYFKQVFPHELARARRYANPASLIICPKLFQVERTCDRPKGQTKNPGMNRSSQGFPVRSRAPQR